jgi:2-methylcitrate dehydratase PrpD
LITQSSREVLWTDAIDEEATTTGGMIVTSCEPTKELSAFIVGTGYSDLPVEVVARTKDCILDWIGCAYAGKGSPTDVSVFSLIREMGGRRTSTLVGTGCSASPMQAALYNGMISAVMEIDDVHEMVSLHPGIGVIPAALAVAEHAGASGKDLLAAVAIGYDVAVRVARAAGGSHYRSWHSTGTCNTFGAAAAAGKLLRLDAERMLMALGLAGTQAAGLWESINASAVTAKHLHSGKAAFNGILSAFLARNGLKGSDTILEGQKGFLASSSTATDQDVMALTQDLGNPFLIMRNFFKNYACCKACIEGIDGIRTLMAGHALRDSDVEKVVVILPPENAWLVGNPTPKDPYEAKFSMPFCIALAAVTGGASVHHFTDRMLQDPRVQEWMRKVEIRADPDLAVRARIEAQCPGRGTFSVEPSIRSLMSEEVREKFTDVVRPVLSARRVGQITDRIDRLEEIGDIREVTRVLRRKIEWRKE